MDFTLALPTAGIPYSETGWFTRDFIVAVFRYFLLFETDFTAEEMKGAVHDVIRALLEGTEVNLTQLKSGAVSTSDVARKITAEPTMFGDEARVRGALDTSDYDTDGDWSATMEAFTHTGEFGNAIVVQYLQDIFIRSLASGTWPLLKSDGGDGEFEKLVKRILDLSDDTEMETFLRITDETAFRTGMKERFLQQRVSAKGLPFAGEVFLMWGLPGNAGKAYRVKQTTDTITVAERIEAFLDPLPVKRQNKRRRTTSGAADK